MLFDMQSNKVHVHSDMPGASANIEMNVAALKGVMAYTTYQYHMRHSCDNTAETHLKPKKKTVATQEYAVGKFVLTHVSGNIIAAKDDSPSTLKLLGVSESMKLSSVEVGGGERRSFYAKPQKASFEAGKKHFAPAYNSVRVTESLAAANLRPDTRTYKCNVGGVAIEVTIAVYVNTKQVNVGDELLLEIDGQLEEFTRASSAAICTDARGPGSGGGGGAPKRGGGRGAPTPDTKKARH